MDELLAAIGARIREARQALGLSQEALAHRAEITTSYLSQIERGKKEPSLSALWRITKGINLSVHDLFADRDVTTSDVRESEVARLLARVPNYKQNALLDVIRAVADLASP